jgi:hypothetical protein
VEIRRLGRLVVCDGVRGFIIILKSEHFISLLLSKVLIISNQFEMVILFNFRRQINIKCLYGRLREFCIKHTYCLAEINF